MIASATTRRWPAALAALSGSFMVGVMPLLARRLYEAGVGAPSMLFWRYLLALPALAAAAALSRLDLRAASRSGAWRIALVGATLGTVQTLCFWESIKTLETSVAVLLFYTYPAVTLALDRLLFNLPIRRRAMLCVAAILAGAMLITAPGLGHGGIDPRGLLWALPSPLVYAFYLAINSRLLRRHPPLVGAGFLYLGMGLSFAAAIPIVGLDVPATSGSWLLILFIALGPGALTATLFSYSVPRLGPSSYAIIANVELVTVVAVGILVLDEPVTPGRAVGGGLILAAILAHGFFRAAPAVAAAPPSSDVRANEELQGNVRASRSAPPRPPGSSRKKAMSSRPDRKSAQGCGSG